MLGDLKEWMATSKLGLGSLIRYRLLVILHFRDARPNYELAPKAAYEDFGLYDVKLFELDMIHDIDTWAPNWTLI